MCVSPTLKEQRDSDDNGGKSVITNLCVFNTSRDINIRICTSFIKQKSCGERVRILSPPVSG